MDEVGGSGTDDDTKKGGEPNTRHTFYILVYERERNIRCKNVIRAATGAKDSSFQFISLGNWS